VRRSLSVLLPVTNAQTTLAASVHELLEMAADLGDPFEVLIIDDGSTDATSEVAQELTHHYPQVRLMRRGRSMGLEAAIRAGVERSRGDVVVLRDETGRFRALEHRDPSLARGSSHPTRPNYLNRLKRFALGE
jgi:glycosyltransferase involved in cell wall biosynthesis